MTDETDVFAEGYDAYLAGTDESRNPYDPETDEHLSWNDGWITAQDDADD